MTALAADIALRPLCTDDAGDVRVDPGSSHRPKFLVDGERIDGDTHGRLHSDPHPHFEPIVMRDR